MTGYPKISKPQKTDDGFVVKVQASRTERSTRGPFPDWNAARDEMERLLDAASCLIPKTPDTPAVVTAPRGPYWDKTAGRWQVRWNEDGEARCFTSQSKPEAQAKRDALQVDPDRVRVKLKSLNRKNFQAKSEHFVEAIADAVIASCAAARRGEGAEYKVLDQHMKLLRNASTAAQGHLDHMKTVEALRELTEWAEGVIAGRIVPEAHATQPAVLISPASTLKGRPGPDPSLN